MGPVSPVQDIEACLEHLLGLTGVDHPKSEQADARMVVLLVVPAKENPAKSACIFNASEALREIGAVFQGLKPGFGKRVVVSSCAVCCGSW